MSVPPYADYMDSGVAWLGMVPSHWELTRVGAKFWERREKVSDADYPPLSVTKHGIVPQLDTAAKTDDNDNRKCVLAGDFVINSRSDRNGSSGLSDLDGSVSLINTVIRAYDGMDGRFIHHLFRSVPFQQEYYRYGKGIVADLWSTNYSEMKAICLAVPPLTEQKGIATFLDRETAKIDALVAEQERLIALLKEKRQAVISHAVTKGLNPNAPMKDSGIEWLGEIPAHWEAVPLKYFGKFNAGAGFPHEEQGVEGEELTFYKVNALGRANAFDILGDSEDTISRETAERLRAFIFPPNTIAFAKIGAALLLGRLRLTDRPACLDNNMMGLAVAGGNSIGFVKHSMSLIRFDYISNPGTVPSLNEGQIANATIARPPIEEQLEIVQRLALETERIDRLTTEAQSAIALLQERRAALISAAVTGRIDVRRLGAPSAELEIA